MNSNRYRRGSTAPTLLVVLCLSLFSATGASAQNVGLELSDSPTFETLVRQFDVGDVVYVRVTAPELDATDLEVNLVSLVTDNANLASEALTSSMSLTNNLDGTYVAAIDSLEAGTWYIRVTLADGGGNGFEADARFSVGPTAEPPAIRMEGTITQLGANHIVVGDRTLFVNNATVIVDESGDPLTFADLHLGDRAVVTIATLSFSGELVADRIARRNNVDQAGIALRGQIESIGDSSMVVLGHTIVVSPATMLFGKFGLPIRFGSLNVGDAVLVRGELLDDDTILASLIRVEDRLDRLVQFSGYIEAVGDAGIVVFGHSVLVLPATKITGLYGEELTFADLAVGLKVHVVATVDATSIPRTFTALRIVVGEDPPFALRGKIESLGDQSLTVAGLQFTVHNKTEIVTETGIPLRFSDLEVGFLVTVYPEPVHIPESASARRIVVHRPSIAIRYITGYLTHIDDAVITVNNHRIRVIDRTEIRDEFGELISFDDLEVGMRVRVGAIHIASNRLDLRLLVAKSIRVLPDRERRVVGRIRAVSDTEINIAGVTATIADWTEILGRNGEEIGVEDLHVGAIAAMHVAKTNTGLVATRIRLLSRIDNAIGVSGVLESVGEHQLVVLGRTFVVLPRTVARDVNGTKIRHDELEIGQPVALRGKLLPGGTLIALHVQQLPNDVDGVKVFGPIESITASTIEVIGIHSFVDGDTKIFDLNGVEVPLADLSVGQTVLVNAEGQPNGTLIAQTIQLQDVSVTAGDVTINDNGTVSVLGVEYVIAPDMVVDFNGEIATNLTQLEDGMYVEVSGSRVGDGAYEANLLTVISTSSLGVEATEPGDVNSPITAHPNYPNPFSESTTITFELPDADAGARTSLTVYDLTGRRVRTLVDATLEAGTHTTIWDGRDDAGRPVASGMYWFRVKSQGAVASRAMLVVR